MCDKKITLSGCLRKHLKEVHGAKNHSCDLCDKKIRPKSLEYHITSKQSIASTFNYFDGYFKITIL